jgi:hypothetical protein
MKSLRVSGPERDTKSQASQRLSTDKLSSLSSAEARSAHLPFSAVFQSMRGFATCHMALRQQRNEFSCSSMNVVPKVGVPCHRAPLGV